MADESFRAPFFAAVFLPGAFFVSAPLMGPRLAAVLDGEGRVAPFTGVVFDELGFFAVALFPAVFLLVGSFALTMRGKKQN